MVTLAIRYMLDPNKLADFEAYVRALPGQIGRCGGTFAGSYRPSWPAPPMSRLVSSISLTLLLMRNTVRSWPRTRMRQRTCAEPRRPLVS
jgi:hypothetical protein